MASQLDRARSQAQASAFAAVLIVIGASCGGALAQGTAAQDAAVATVQTFVKAIETADLDVILGSFTDDATVFFPSDRPQRASGKGEIRAVFAELFKHRTGAGAIIPRDVSVMLIGDVAIVTAHLRALPAQPIRETTAFPRRTFVLRRVEGRWLIVHLHASNFVLAPAPQ